VLEHLEGRDLGVCSYELLTDRVPFGGDTVTAVAAAFAIDPALPITEYCQKLPAALARVISTSV
jgi:hypothetical protein